MNLKTFNNLKNYNTNVVNFIKHFFKILISLVIVVNTIFYSYLISFSVISFAEKKNEYDIDIHVPTIIHFDNTEKELATDDGYENIFSISIKTVDMTDIKEIDLCYNLCMDIFDFPEHPYEEPTIKNVKTINKTDSHGNSHIVFYWKNGKPDNTMSDTGLFGYANIQLVPKNVGDISFDIIGGTVTYLDGTVREAKININDYYKKVVNLSELIPLEQKDMAETNVILLNEIAAGELKTKYDSPDKNLFNAAGQVLEESDMVGTGSVLNAYYKGYVYDTRTFIYIGDVDGNGKITAADARLVLRASAQLEALNNFAALAANIDDSNSITAADARLILRKSAKIE